jgi:hypothetical protein
MGGPAATPWIPTGVPDGRAAIHQGPDGTSRGGPAPDWARLDSANPLAG